MKIHRSGNNDTPVLSEGLPNVTGSARVSQHSQNRDARVVIARPRRDHNLTTGHRASVEEKSREPTKRKNAWKRRMLVSRGGTSFNSKLGRRVWYGLERQEQRAP